MSNNNVLNRIEQPNAAGDNVYNLGGTVNTDAITELTADTGVTVDGVLLKDGTVKTTGPAKIDANTGIEAFATGGQGSATALTGQYNNVTTVASAGDSVKLLTDVAGLKQTVKNSGVATLAVFPNTSDSINALAVNLSIDLLPGAEATFIGVGDTIWETKEAITLNAPTTQRGSFTLDATDNAANHDVKFTNASHGQDTTTSVPDPGGSTGTVMLLEPAQLVAGIQTYGAINNLKATDAITAFSGGGQGSAVQLTSQVNRITVSAAAGDSVKLPTAVPGQDIEVSNIGANSVDVFPISGDLIDTLSADVAVSLPSGESIRFTCSVALKWKSTSIPQPGASFTTGTTATTFASGELTGGAFTVYDNTQGTPGSIATRTATEMFADDIYARVGGSYHLRIINRQGTGTLTATAGAGVTLTGAGTVAVNTFRDFIVTYTSATALVIQSVGIGTDS